ncbi:ABC transporter substrate-binding protein [Trichlorobacter lovleyi]|uniref:ABC transporter substrate-binding protein n=3 Tax=Trichlorobacter lovleyi TaxID=313985 RepID=UPI002FDD26E6
MPASRQAGENFMTNERITRTVIHARAVMFFLLPPCRRLRPCLVLLLLSFFQLFFTSTSWSAEPLRISVSKTPLSLPVYVADSMGYFSSEGLPIKISEVIGGHRTLHELLAGNADLATSSDAVVMFNSFECSDYAVIATFVTSADDIKIITRSGTGITHPLHLQGKHVGTVTGAASHYYLDMLLLLHGGDPRSVQLHNLQPEAMADALKHKQVDAVAIWEPYPFTILKSVPGTRTLPKSSVYRLTFNLVAHKRLLGVRDNDLVKLLRALDRAEQFIKLKPAHAMSILRNRLQLDQSFIYWIWPRYNYRLSLDQSLLTTLEGESRWARQEGYIKKELSPNYLDFVYTGPLNRVRPESISIVR